MNEPDDEKLQNFVEFFDGEIIEFDVYIESPDEPVYYDAENNPYTLQELPEDEIWN